MDPNNIIILTAVYNDWEAFKRFLVAVDEIMAKHKYTVSIMVVDDGSPTFADEEDFSLTHLTAISKVTSITMTRNLGNQRAIAIGLGYIARNIDCGHLVIMDSDLEDLPDYIPQLIETAKTETNHIVFADRTSRPNGYLFMLFYHLYKRLYKLSTGMSISMGNFVLSLAVWFAELRNLGNLEPFSRWNYACENTF